MKRLNPYYLFLKQLLTDMRLTVNGFQEKYGMKSFSTIMNKLKNNPDKLLHPETLYKIEKALHIKIDNSDLSNITYTNLNSVDPLTVITEAVTNPKYSSFPVVSIVRAGTPNGVRENEILYYAEFNYPKREGVVALLVEGDSMANELKHGDIVLVDKNIQPLNNNIVVAIFANGDHTIKWYRQLLDNLIELYPENKNYPSTIITSDKLSGLYKVVRSLRHH